MDEQANQVRHAITPWQRRAAILASLAFLVALVAPHLGRWQHPSLFADDIVRVSDLRHNPLKRLLFRPINEHVAPLTEVLSWTCWRLAGERLTRVPATFTAAALASLAAAIGLMGWLVRRETGSGAAACAAMALLGGSAVALETYWWYSACTFTWALVFTLASLALAGAATRGRPWVWGLAAALAALAAPAWSGIGLLAGPAAFLRGMLAVPAPSARGLVRAGLPLLGTIAYLVLVRWCAPDVLDTPTQRWRASPGLALLAGADAFVNVLIPETLAGLTLSLPAGLALVIVSGLMLLFLLGPARRHPNRGLLAAAMLLVVAGYVLPYLARVSPGYLDATRQVQRYHLFPLAGLIVIGVSLALPVLCRLDRHPGAAPALGVALLLVLSLTQGPRREAFGQFYRFPHQAATLAAIERVDAIAVEAGLTTVQARAAIGPLRPNWMVLKEFDATMLIGPAASVSQLPDAQARAVLLSALSPTEREALAEPVEGTTAQVPASAFPTVVGVGRLQSAPGVQIEPAGGIVAFQGPKFLEFALESPPLASPPTALGLPAGVAGALELWWADADGRWSPARSVRWRDSGANASAIPLDRLPLWQPDHVRRLRVIVRRPGPARLVPPQLLR